jgi:hypothetical protein
MQTNVKVLGGLEITVEFTICESEKDIGINFAYSDDWRIVAIANRPLRSKESAQWIYKRLSKQDEANIQNAISECLEGV